ncbi:MAG: hypothetical protein AB8H86_10725 [Polyangiales bacterium]
MKNLRFALLAFGLLACADDDARGLPDGSVADSGSVDSGGSDSGSIDSGGLDSGGSDSGGSDSGVMECASSTLRLTSPLPQMTTGSGDDYDPVGGCVAGLATGPDRIYALVPVEGAGTYRVTVTPVTDDWNPMIYVVTDCSGEMCLDGTNLNGSGVADSLDIDIEDGEVLYVVVDTALSGNFEGGPFTLSTEKL